MTAEDSANADRHQQLRQLGHDIKSYLGVVTMGFEALDGAKSDPEDFAEVLSVIRQEGVKPLKESVLELIELACKEAQN